MLLVIPAYNEEHRLEAPLRAYLGAARRHPRHGLRLLVVLNGCTDGTRGVVARVAADFPELAWMEYAAPIGKGGALLAGFRQGAAFRWVGFTDADGATTPESLFGMLDGLPPSAGAVIGRRDMRGRSFLRRLRSRCFHHVVRLLLGLRHQDIQCGAKFFHGEQLARILPGLTTMDMAIDVDLLGRLADAGAEIHEREVAWHDQPGSKVLLFRTSALMFLSVGRLACGRLPGALPLLDLFYRVIAGRPRALPPGETAVLGAPLR